MAEKKKVPPKKKVKKKEVKLPGPARITTKDPTKPRPR